jgi:hypothetical protein
LEDFRPATGIAALAYLKRASAHLLIPRCYPAVLSRRSASRAKPTSPSLVASRFTRI